MPVARHGRQGIRVDAEKITADVPECVIPAAEFASGQGVLVAKLLVLSGICRSNGDGRRLIQQGAVSIDGEKVTDPNAALTSEAIAAKELTLRAGKKNFRKLVLG